ncbi:amidase [Nocardioides sp. HDW12B]|uniref:amidase n=1 Tax=Nocardioides sp. HDW12B TaxID=2714939 RepID=UPI00140D9B9B|nr:amidase [Nocardioides sp. HDW12B]QIK67168.1 amidase [Nocardioides sp. HDW12B]
MTSPTPPGHPVHAFSDDALGSDDATGVAARIRSGEISAAEVAAAAIDRAESLQPVLNAVQHAAYDAGGSTSPGADAVFAGVPTFVKDNADVKGLPTNHGTEAFVARPAKADGPVVTQLRSLGVTVLGKSRLPEFGFSASTEYAGAAPVRNPWDPRFSAGASSGGSAALVAGGAVPLAHANDGGGSIRIPAAACGLVGLKATRGRVASDPADRAMPVGIVAQGVVTRSVRDTARFLAAVEEHRRAPGLPPVRLVEGPGRTRLRVGVTLDSLGGAVTDEETRKAVLSVADLLSGLGHHVEEAAPPAPDRFADDFAAYWALLGALISRTGRLALGRDFDASRTDALTQGLARTFRRQVLSTPGVVRRLRRSTAVYRTGFATHDVYLSPVLSHTTPEIGFLSPGLGFEELFERLRTYVAFTPLQNATGTPAVSLPLAQSSRGLPIGVQLAGDLGDERTLLELAFELEAARPFARIQDAPGAALLTKGS